MSISETELLAKQLKEQGYAVVVPENPADRFHHKRECFISAVFKKSQFFTEDAEDGVMGGFSAFATPDSFHSPIVRWLRRLAEKHMQDFFAAFMKSINMEDANLQVLFDRAVYRIPGKVVGGESGHRDECAFALDGDHILGGWANFDCSDQFFHCVPGTHTGANKHGGFSKLTKDEAAHYEKLKQVIVIPPGGILVFYENMVHFVANSKCKEPSCRLFLGWRITNSAEPMDPETVNYIIDQAVPRIKSGQKPAMFAQLHMVNHIGKLQDWSQKNIKHEFRIKHAFKTGKHVGKAPFIITKRFMPSLREISTEFPEKFRMFRPYSDVEFHQMMPHKLGSKPSSEISIDTNTS